MVGGGTGAVMTAVTMIFEMTLDYSIVMPMIVAVAMSIGARRIDCACIARAHDRHGKRLDSLFPLRNVRNRPDVRDPFMNRA